MSDEVVQAVADVVQQSNDILCVSHVNPDGDAVGSLLGIGWMLHYLGKHPTLALADPVPDQFGFLPGAEEVIGPGQVAPSYDLIICLDSSSPDRMGSVYQEKHHQRIPLVIIDHHVTNTYFGDVNWVKPTCVATCQMLVELAEVLKVPLESDLAHCLLTGIVTDTLCFATSNTGVQVLQTALKLMEGGANLANITAQTVNSRPFSVLRLRGMVLSNARLEDGVIWGTVTRGQLQSFGEEEGDANLSSSLIQAAEADISAAFTEKVDDRGNLRVECSFRAKPGFNVAEVAYQLGGGGHPPASGCTLSGSLTEVTSKVVSLLKQVRAEQAAQRNGVVRSRA